LLLQAHQMPTPQQTLESFRALVTQLGPVPYHLLRRLTALLRAYVKENDGKPGCNPNLLQELGDIFAPLVFWMPIRDPMRVRPTSEQLGGVPPGHVLVQINIPPLGFTTRQALPLNCSVARLRVQMLVAANAPTPSGWNVWMAPPNPVQMVEWCTLRQYNVQNTDVIIINNEDMPEKPTYVAAASSILRCISKNHAVFYPPIDVAAPPLLRRVSMAPTHTASSPPGALQRRSTMGNVLIEQPQGMYMAPSLEIFAAPGAAPNGMPVAMQMPARAGPPKPRGPTFVGGVGDANLMRSSTIDLTLPPAVIAVPSPFLTSDNLSAAAPLATAAAAAAAAPAAPAAALSERALPARDGPLPVRTDLANRPRAPMPPPAAAPEQPPAKPVMQPARRVSAPAAGRRAAVVRDAYQPLAEARKRGSALTGSDDEAAGGAGGAGGADMYQDIPSKWAPELASGDTSPATAKRESPSSGGSGAAVSPAGVRKSDAVTHYGSSSMLQQGMAANKSPAGARPSFSAKPAF
jgi:hypothetical protein